MKILAISDLHGDVRLARLACAELRPDLLLCCGDWGDAGLVQEKAFAEFLELCPVLTVFGNHDSLELLASLNNQDGSPVLLAQGEVRVFNNLRVAGISGIWAKSHRLPHYVTDTDVREWSNQIARQGPIDVLLTHGCPVGLADLTPTGRHGGQRCFLDAFRTVAPQIHLCGHLHVAQERVLKDGRKVINVGATPEGSVAILTIDPATRAITSHLESIRNEPQSS
jgi:Icc-related predicted phosphoesterase